VGYAWPGNVRELANVMERATVLGQPPRVTVQDLPPRVIATEAVPLSGMGSYQVAVNTYRRELILTALARTGGNRAAAAKALGLHRTHLMRLLKALQIP
jgi:DNA-binding NtrC family response regulator